MLVDLHISHHVHSVTADFHINKVTLHATKQTRGQCGSNVTHRSVTFGYWYRFTFKNSTQCVLKDDCTCFNGFDKRLYLFQWL